MVTRLLMEHWIAPLLKPETEDKPERHAGPIAVCTGGLAATCGRT